MKDRTYLSIAKLRNELAETATINLEPEWIDKALTIAKKFHNSLRQFNLYLQSLALFTFESWLSIREPNLQLELSDSSLFKPEIANIIDVVCNFKIGNFLVCLIPLLDTGESEVMIPRYAIDIPEFTAHFYVLIEIDEELEIAKIAGFIDYNILSKHKKSYPLDKDWNYGICLSLFEDRVDRLLLNLQCLTDDAITLPMIEKQQNLTNFYAEIIQVLPEIQEQPLWKKLTWSQAVIVLTNSELRNWLYQSLTNCNSQFHLYLQDLLKLLTQKSIQLQKWMQIQFEYLESSANWQMLPANTISHSLRNLTIDRPETTLDGILTQINNSLKLDIPHNIGRAYQDFTLEVPLRLYAVTWLISELEKTWSLLLILGSTPEQIPPYGVKLRISDRNKIVQEQELTADLGSAYLCTYLEANTEDLLLVTITAPNSDREISHLFEFRL